MTTQAVPEEIRRAATAARDLASQVGAVPLVEVPDLAETSVPGGQTETAAAALATAWRTRLDDVSRAVDTHADLLRGAAGSYDAQEAANRQPFVQPPGGLTPW